MFAGLILTIYAEITSIIKEDLSLIDKEINNILHCYGGFGELNYFDFSRSKKIRSVVTVLTLKMLFGRVTDKQIRICALTELIHNASLIHDDIIDNSDYRRCQPSLKKLSGNKQAVVFGDLILSLCLRELSRFENCIILEIFAQSMENMCKGELFQLKNENQIPEISDYITKSQNKTAELFSAALTAALSAEKQDKFTDFARSFCINFGTAFQIRNDIDDIFLNPAGVNNSDDIKNCNFTAPVIFAYLQDKNFSYPNIEDIRNSAVLDMSNALCADFCNKALDLLSDFNDNLYRQNLIALCGLVKQGSNYGF